MICAIFMQIIKVYLIFPYKDSISQEDIRDKKEYKKIKQALEEMESLYALDYINDMRKIDPFIVEAFETLGKERIEELNYSERKIREEMILTQRKGNKVVRLVKNIFKVGNRYSNEKIVMN